MRDTEFEREGRLGQQGAAVQGASGAGRSDSIADDGLHSAGAVREWGHGAAGGYGRSADYGHAGGAGRWGGAEAGTTPDAERGGSLVQRHWMRSGDGSFALGPLLAGVGIGAALMYFLDPARGTRRRHMVADQVASAARSARDALRDRSVDVRNRTAGAAAEVRGRLSEEPVTDEQLVARVRAELGHHVERVRPIEVTAEHGCVILSGQVRDDELPTVLATVEKVRGVERVENRLQPSAE